MTDTETQGLNIKTILLIILVAIVTSVVVTLIQTLILGKANVAITGGVVGAIIVVTAMSARRKKSVRPLVNTDWYRSKQIWKMATSHYKQSIDIQCSTEYSPPVPTFTVNKPSLLASTLTLYDLKSAIQFRSRYFSSHG